MKRLPRVESEWSAVLQTLEGHLAYVSAAAFLPDGKVLASASYDKMVKLLEAGTGAALQTLQGHLDLITALSFSPDSKLLTSASHDKTVKLWEAGTSTELHTHRVEAVVSTLSFSNDGVLPLSDRGAIDTGFLPAARSLQHSTSPEIFVYDQWIALQGSRMLWLPPEYQGASTALCRDVVALGQRSGRVSLLAIAL
jgi:hypothetical protein